MKTSKIWRASIGGVLIAVLLAFSIVGIAWAAQPSLDQCANGPFSAPTTTCSWQSGNINDSNSHYSEGDYVPFRLVMPGLTVSNTYTTTIEYDFIESSGKHAYDYLGTYNNTVTGANPCLGVTGCSSSTQFPIPTDTTCLNAQPPTQQFMTIFGGEITSVTRLGTHPCQSGSAVAVQYQIVFHASAVNVVLAWAGHIATQADWGPGQGATGINGSPYHMRLISFCDPVCAGGNQDRSLSAGAVAAVTLTTQAAAASYGAPTHDVATIMGSVKNVPVVGTLTFYLCADTVAPYVNPDCSTGGVVIPPTVNVTGNGNYNSGNITISGPGAYCYRAEFTPANDSPYPFTSATNLTTECFTITGPTAVKVDTFDAHSDTFAALQQSGWMVVALGGAGVLVMGLLALVFLRKR